MQMIEAWVGIGANQGAPHVTLSKVAKYLEGLVDSRWDQSWVVSSVYSSEPWGGVKQARYLNQVIGVKSSPQAMIKFASHLFTLDGLKAPEDSRLLRRYKVLSARVNHTSLHDKKRDPISQQDFEWAELLLDLLLLIERITGRLRSPDQARWGPRVIDLDVLAITQGVPQRHYSSETLTLPHPRLQMRNFVLDPWAEIAPALVLTQLNSSISELRDQCDDLCKVWRLS